ncbi:MAG: family 16 glycoside hydrolase [Planctomycetaceae bacterium]
MRRRDALLNSRVRCLFLTTMAALLGIGCLPSVSSAEEDVPATKKPLIDDVGEFKDIFDGKTLEGWDGNPKFWRVEDGMITGETTKENPTDGNTFLIWRKGQTADFQLKLEYKIVGGNSGIQYRSFEVPDKKWVVGGYQGDFEAGDTYSGILYGERFRGILCERGQKSVIGSDHKPKVVGAVGDSKEIQKKIRKEDWNEYEIIASGNRFIHKINGLVTADCTDEDVEMRRDSGILALQLHAGPPMKVQFRNIKLKSLPPMGTAENTKAKPKNIWFIAGKASHGYGAHEHRAGCFLLAKALRESVPNVNPAIFTNGWPEDSSGLAKADTIVVYADGGAGHPFYKHLDEMNALMKKGIGLVCIHYAVEVPKGPAGDRFVEWTGGYFEPHWSVNPHWTAQYSKLPEHPITRGVKPFTINDEWYYHMRFPEGMKDVAPILTAIPPKETLSRPDGPHSGNPTVRSKVGQPQHMAWARERADGGRGFGITGGHDHWNWGHDQFRKLVLNAIIWTAQLDVPENGVESAPLTVQDLEANQDETPPADYNPARIQKLLEEWNQSEPGA